jgi:phage tail sheath protein FI
MPEYLSPGVYVEEISSGSKPIEGVSTSTAGFLGSTERGPEPPYLITSWLEFQRWYGGFKTVPDSYLPYAVEGFFDNGGKRCFVTRIVRGGDDGAKPATGTIGKLTVSAIGRGAWGNNVAIKVQKASQLGPVGNWFRVSILYYTTYPANFVDPTDPNNLGNKDRKTPDYFEDFDNLTFVPGASNNVVTTINSASHLIRTSWGNNTPEALPEQGFQRLTGGLDPAAGLDVTIADYQGSPEAILDKTLFPDEPVGRGLAALETIDEVSLLIAPDEVRSGLSANLSQTVIGQCERLRDRFAIVSAPQTPTESNRILVTQDTTFAGLYFPWIYVYDPSLNKTVLVPPSGHVAGIFAKTDIDRGVHKAPANEVVLGATDLQLPIPKGVQDILNPKGVNCIRDFRIAGRGIRLWGARTMSSDPEWKYVNVRRLFLYLEKSIDHGTQWVVFEPNDEPLWAKVRRNLTNFLVRVWKSGALMGATEAEAFFVKCDRTTMTQDDIDNGRLICYIGVAPVKPAEFVIFRISQKTLDAKE